MTTSVSGAGAAGGVSGATQAQLDAIQQQREQEAIRSAKEGLRSETLAAKKTNMEKLRF